MINLKLSHFSRQNRNFIVKLGNGTRHEFRSEKETLKFLCNTSKFLTERYNELNLLFADVFTLYRQSYFYLDNNRHQPHAKLYSARRKINDQVNTIETLFEKISFAPMQSDSNLLIFKQLYYLIDCLSDICLQIKHINSNKSYAATLIRSDYLLKQLQEEKQLLQQYGLKTAVAFEPDLLYKIDFESAEHLKIVS